LCFEVVQLLAPMFFAKARELAILIYSTKLR